MSIKKLTNKINKYLNKSILFIYCEWLTWIVLGRRAAVKGDIRLLTRKIKVPIKKLDVAIRKKHSFWYKEKLVS